MLMDQMMSHSRRVSLGHYERNRKLIMKESAGSLMKAVLTFEDVESRPLDEFDIFEAYNKVR